MVCGQQYIHGCSGCSRSDRQRPANERTGSNQVGPITPDEKVRPRRTNEPNEVQLQETSGVYTIPVTVNGVLMQFIFDTGASLISISETEAAFLYKQGTLTEDDFIEKAEFSDANGDVSEGTIVRLRSVKIGSRTLYDIRAVVVSGGKAPLLLGQSALSQFGKVSVDYAHKTVSLD